MMSWTDKTLVSWAIAVVVVLIAVYALTIPRSITLEDAGLFQMVCHRGGIGHPPGYPLFILGCQAVVPWFGSSVFAANFLSAVFAALTCGLVVFISYELLEDKLVAVTVALTYGLSVTFWSQAIVVEVYSLAALLFVACFWACIRFQKTGNQKFIFLLAFLYGLGLTNHWPLLGLSTPALIAVLLPRLNEILLAVKSFRSLAITTVVFLLGLSPYLTLFQQAPLFALYGEISSLDEFVKYVSRAAYNDQFEAATWVDKVDYQWWLLGQSLIEYGVLVLPLVIAGLILSFRMVSPAVSVSLVLLYLGSTTLLVLLLGFEFNAYRQAIFRPYPVIAYLSIGIWLGIGLSALLRWLADKGMSDRLVIPIAGVIVASVLVTNFAENNRRDTTFALEYAENLLGLTPENAVLFAEGDVGVGMLGYLHHVRGLRPDLELRSWNNLVFQNRLVSSFATDEVQKVARDNYINEIDKRVFTTVFHGWPAINHGLVYEVSDRRGFECDGELHAYIAYLIETEEHQLLTDGHERELLFGLLLDFTRQHVGIVLQSGSEREDEVLMLAALQTTFAGKLATLESMVGLQQDESGKMMLEELAMEAQEMIPGGSSRQVRGVLQEYLGRIALMDPGDPETAQVHFEHSIDIYPVAANKSICSLKSVYRDLEIPSGLAQLAERFPQVSCEGRD